MSLKRTALGLAAVGLSSTALAQPPISLSTPVGPGAFPPMSGPIPGPGPVGIAPRPAMPTQNTLWSYIGVSADQREYRQRGRADTPLGQLRQRILPNPRLATPSLAELQAPGPVGAASQVKLDRANAEKRVAAVEYLGTVDCHYWPEAEDALIGALRGDRNESVRLAAAQTLLNGCCCTKKVIKALAEAASGTDCDGFPAERSSRVRDAAQTALEHCLECFCEIESRCPDKNCDKKPAPLPELAPLPKPGGEKTDDPNKKPGGEKSMTESYYERVAKMPSAEVIADGRKALLVSIPIDAPGQGINQLDLIAAGEPGPDAAGARSPRPTSLVNWFSAKPSTPGVAPVAVRSTGAANVVVHQTMPEPAPAPPSAKPMPMSHMVASPSPASAPAPPAAKPMPMSHMVSSPSMAPALPMPSKPMPASTTAAATPMPSKLLNTAAPPSIPPARTVPVSTEVTPSPEPARTTTVNPVFAPAVMPSKPAKTPKPMPVQENRAEDVANMMKGLVPVSELTAGINSLMAEDLKSHPALTKELISAGAGSSNTPVRRATILALVRCQVKTPEAMKALQTAAQSDPDQTIRATAAAALDTK